MTTQVTFRKAEKRKLKLRMAIAGPSGSGKTFTALRVGRALVGERGRIAVVDTESRSSELYADEFAFDVLPLGEPFDPYRYVAAVKAAEAEGYDLLIVDSTSHAWSGPGGVLEMVEGAKRQARRNPHPLDAWKEVGTPAYNALLQALMNAKLHVICTFRSRSAWSLEKDETTGKVKPKKVGLEAVTRDNTDYEFTVYGEMDLSHTYEITKTRCKALKDAAVREPGEEFGHILRDWLNSGAPEEASERPAARAATNSASNGEPPRQRRKGKRAAPAEDKAPPAQEAPAPAAPPRNQTRISRKQRERLWDEAVQLGLTSDEAKAVMGSLGIARSDEVPLALLGDLMAAMRVASVEKKERQKEAARPLGDRLAEQEAADAETEHQKAATTDADAAAAAAAADDAAAVQKAAEGAQREPGQEG